MASWAGANSESEKQLIRKLIWDWAEVVSEVDTGSAQNVIQNLIRNLSRS